jgi:hypothetical protein
MIEPIWQNYSSMYREAVTAQEAKTGMELSHHLTSSLYFAISALEAFLNSQMRKHLSATHTEKDIYDRLRRGKIVEKLKKWPEELLGKPMKLRNGTMDTISLFNDVRGDLTHPKTEGHSTYKTLEQVDPKSVIDVVAEYIAQYHEARGDQFHYWLWGWNYLNPRPDLHEIILLNSQQFFHSMRALGFNANSRSNTSEAFQQRFMSGYAGWKELGEHLYTLDRCEPKHSLFPYQPKLCRLWWTKEHHRICGNVTREAIDAAIAHDRAYDKP